MVLCWSGSLSEMQVFLLLSKAGHFLHWNAEMPLDPPWESMLRLEAISLGVLLTLQTFLTLPYLHLTLAWVSTSQYLQLSPVSPCPVHCDRPSLLASCWSALSFPFRVLMVTQLPSFYLETKGDWENETPGSARLTKLPCLSCRPCWPRGHPLGNCVGLFAERSPLKAPKWTRAQDSGLQSPFYLPHVPPPSRGVLTQCLFLSSPTLASTPWMSWARSCGFATLPPSMSHFQLIHSIKSHSLASHLS